MSPRTAQGRRARLASRLATAVRDAGLELGVTVLPAGAVVSDGAYRWTCRPGALLRALRGLVSDGTAARLSPTALDGDQAPLYDAICRRVARLSRGGERDRALHQRLVRAWQRETGLQGAWA